MTECKGGGGGGNRLQLNGFKLIQYLRTSMNPSVLALDGGSFTRDSETQMREGSGNGVSLSLGALCREYGQGAPALCTLMLNFNLLTSFILLVTDHIPV
jgi:hypothetical protein